MTDGSLIGRQIDEYRLEKMLGEGGMAAVYRALDTRLNRYVAVKVIRTAMRADADYKMRFEREAQAIAQLDHPNIITLYRFGEQDGLLYMAMQYVDGADLAAVIDSFHSANDYIEYEEIIPVAHEIGAALDYAHGQGVIHRDVKPHNIMINQDGNVLVTDFGLALMTDIGTQGETFGSPHYIAPEQAISSAGAVPQSDIYSMGVVLYEMLTGTVPFDASEPLDIAMMHMSEPIPPPRERRPDLSAEIEAVLMKALAKYPDERYASGSELADALERAMETPSRPSRSTISSKVEMERQANPLPPIPAAVSDEATAPHEAASTQERRKAATLPPEPAASTAPRQQQAPASQATPRSAKDDSNSRRTWLYLLPIVLVLLGGALFAFTRMGGSDDADNLAEAITATTAAESNPTRTDISAAATDIANAATQPPTEAAPPTSAPTTAPTNTAVPPPLEPTAAPTLTSAPVEPTATRPIDATRQNLRLLTDGQGVWTNQPVTDGDFQVEGYCSELNSAYGVGENGEEWFCTQNGERVQTLGAADFNQICRRTYDSTAALAIQTGEGDRPAYSWRCFAPRDATTESAESYTIIIQWADEDSLFITNRDPETPFPLAPLTLLGGEDSRLRATEWGVAMLQPGECVAVWKDGGNPNAANESCQRVGERLERQGRDRFWKASFSVFYNGSNVDTCTNSPCVVSIRP